jgi:hypothetical protein
MSCDRDGEFASTSCRAATQGSPTIPLMTEGTNKNETVLNDIENLEKIDVLFPLTNLPNELIDHVFFFLDSTAPSDLNFNEQPSSDYTNAQSTPLKDVSRVSRRLRDTVLPRLFANVRLDPYRLTPFLTFINHHKLSRHVNTIVAQLQGPCNHIHPAWWARLLNEVSARTFTITCAPHVFAELVNTTIVSADAWAFNMSHQILTLKQDSDSVDDHISLTDLPSLFSARRWTDLSVNEGSSLKAYTTYEYFLRRTPSLLGTLHASKSTIADSMFASLQSFTFTAIFPFYNHVDEILKSVRKMRCLKVLRMKICPEPHSTVLVDEIDAAGGHIDVNDPWNEFDTAYRLIAHTVLFLSVEGRLEEFRVDDVKMSGIRENLEGSITERLQESWIYRGDGIWSRQMQHSPILPPAV